MGARTLQTRLTLRLLAVAGVVLVAVGAGAVVVTDRALDAADTASARAEAAGMRESLERELDEGDSADQALEEVVADAEAEGIRLRVLRPRQASTREASPPPELVAGACATFDDDHGRRWRACSSESARSAVVAAVPAGEHRAAVAALARGMAAIVAVALVVLALAVRRALRGPLAELAALVAWTSRVVETEHPAAPPPSATEEIAKLESAFDTLVRRLLDALARERAASAHIAHELRTPLTAIVAELDALRLPDEGSREIVARIRSDVARLSDVIDAILVLSDGRPTPAGAPLTNLADLARELAPEGAGVEAPDEALVAGDERLVALALRNLFDNARKYGDGVQLVRVSRAGAGVRVSVVDRGPGVEPAARAKMFDRYWRGTADGEGRGLGLALVRAVAERHGGHAEAHPGPQGTGLDVSFTIEPLVGWHEGATGAPR